MAVHVNYYLIGSGWAECYVCIEGQSAHLIASYLGDALGDLVRAVVDILGTATESDAWFAEEPGEHRWCLRRIDPGRVQVRILRYDDDVNQSDAEPTSVVLDAECRLRTFAGAVLAAAQQVLREHGEDGYLQKWHGHPYPTELVDRLKALLDQGAGRELADHGLGERAHSQT